MTCSHPHRMEVPTHTSFVKVDPVSQQSSALGAVEAVKPPHYYLGVPEVPHRVFEHQVEKMGARFVSGKLSLAPRDFPTQHYPYPITDVKVRCSVHIILDDSADFIQTS